MSAIRFLIVSTAAAAVLGTAVGTALGAEDQSRSPRQRGPAALFDRFDENHDGKLAQSEVPEKAWQRLSQADADGDGAVTKEELAAARPPRGERGPRDEGRRPAPGKIIEHLDTDGDGKISKTEAPEKLAEHFDKVDKDGDGFITADELRRGKGEHHFKQVDQDGDGKISRAEAPEKMAKHFDQVDADGDGYVTREELRAAYEAHRNRRGNRAE